MSVPSRIILVTGANRGIGNAIVERLISASASGPQTQTEAETEENWTIILACRTKRKAQSAIEECRLLIQQNTATAAAAGNNLRLYPLELDLASDESIAAAKEEVKAKFERVDGIFPSTF